MTKGPYSFMFEAGIGMQTKVYSYCYKCAITKHGKWFSESGFKYVADIAFVYFKFIFLTYRMSASHNISKNSIVSFVFEQEK